MILQINEAYPQPRRIEKIVQVLRSEGTIIYPTDTVYGLGCDIHSKKALDKVRRIKKMDNKRPLSFVFADLKSIAQYAQVEDSDYKILRKYLPGPYTFVLNATRLVPRIVLTKRNEVGIRIPDNKICQALVTELGNPILSSSVRLPDDQLLWDPKEIDRIYKGQVDLVVDGGDFVPEPSTVISLVDGAPVVLREGKGDVTPFL
ncbi:L-threonylcarbamoyladenylate synthase [Desulfomonile tiedjei]|uniref:Translation factor SUA5 n=1 Tax=Desulfomonile tiedjei (strain ATCC 49306 / DSM 6799 / DCB-1) TaxID=706587 RepID=I4C2S7_DESTA|nr:L-threonylcarbamoyladenylate synthase [Desulfomonile tiedjei]AFM23868.1 translation factor SUA5 [Desulfomonile tiedjei DSM 6799]